MGRQIAPSQARSHAAQSMNCSCSGTPALSLPTRAPVTMTERVTPAPMASLRAARELTLALQGQVVESALVARGAGEAWEDVAVAFGQQVGGRPDAAAAYLCVLGVRGGDPWWSPSRGVLWTCSSCEEAVRDLGPDAGSPEERESGHAPNCSRHSADVVAWEALWA